MPQSIITGLPGVRAAKVSTSRIVFKQGDWLSDLAGGKEIDGANASDVGNIPITDLRAGVLMGKITASSLYGTSVIDTLQANASSSATTLVLTVAGATELVRRNGASGTFLINGPATAGASMASETVTYSAVSLTTGHVTCTGTTNAYLAGSLIGAGDGSEAPLTLIGDMQTYGVKVTDSDDTTRITVPFAVFPIAGVIITANVLVGTVAMSTLDASIKTYIKGQLSSTSGGKFVFDDQF